MEVHRGGVGRVPLKSTGHSAPLRDGPQYHCRPQNQWAPDKEVEKWEKEIHDIFAAEEHKFEEAEILDSSKDFPTHSGIQTPVLNAVIGQKPKEITERREEELKSTPALENREEFPSLGKDLNEEAPQLFGTSRQELIESEKMPRHGVSLEEFIDNDRAGQTPQNIEGKVCEHRSETAPDSGIQLGKGLKKELAKPQAQSHRFEEAEILQEARDFPAHSGIQTPVLERAIHGDQPELNPPSETDKEKKEMKEVHSMVDDVKHAAQVVGSKIAAGAHEVKEMLSDAVHHLTTTTEASDSAKSATDETGYNTCA
ncbi:unnamed protein product, partial [Mesorhabditis belari]|uniref:Uncharacterized protein n=1 Tax=Mesorhabditis belari TaxID=2138241 RepID=A0AAF3F387_9BILA